MEEVRKILVAIDDSDGALRALQWTLDNFYREGDILALLHVIPRPQAATSYGAPPVDMLPSSSTVDQEQQALEAQRFIREKFLPRLQGCADEPEVHIVRVRAEPHVSTIRISCNQGLQQNCIQLNWTGASCSEIPMYADAKAFASFGPQWWLGKGEGREGGGGHGRADIQRFREGDYPSRALLM